MTTKLVLVMLLCAAAFMVPAKAQFDFGCFMKAGQGMMTCSMKCKINFACLERCGSDAFQAMSKCGKPPALAPTSLTKMSEGPAQVNAIAALVSSSDKFVTIEGSLHFVQSLSYDAPKTYIQGRITGLAPGRMHGLHIHFNSKCRDLQNHEGASYLGLGNVAADESGVAEFSIAESSLTLVGGGPDSVLGHALVVHPQPDHHMGILRGTGNEEYGTEATGEYCPATVLACGIIQFTKSMTD